MAHRGRDGAYGDLAERRAKMDSKYDSNIEAAQRAWIKEVTGIEVGSDFQADLKSGVTLCKLINALAPGSVKSVYSGNMAFKQMENIANFCKACLQYGVRSDDVFQTPDLYEGTNMACVQVTLDNVARIMGLKAEGKEVAPATVKDSVLIPKGKIAAVPKVTKSQKNTGVNPDHYRPTHKGAEAEAANSATPNDKNAYGDLAERLAKMDAKYDKGLEDEIRKWIESKSGESIGPDFHAGLKDGKILCALANALKPGSVKKVNQQSMAFKQMENINNFLKAAESLGVISDDKFQTVDLYEAGNMTQVLLTLSSLKRVTGG